MNETAPKVLVIDDDESIRKSLCKLLQGEGYRVSAVADGAEAVEKYCGDKKPPIDMLVVDLNMPLKNGWATLDRFLEVNPLLPVLIVTGQPNQYAMAEAAGVSGLVEKPIDVPMFLQLIHKLLVEPAKSCLHRMGHQVFPLHLVRATGCTSLPAWKNRNTTSYHHGGLNE